jgi:threonine/homoserine/homoserine lactone efflux protein
MITLTYVLASLALLIAPGPNVVFIITQSITHGRKAGFACVLGGVAAMIVLTLLVAVGLAGLLAASPIAFNVVKWAGAAYLVYIGVKTLLSKEAINFDSSAAQADLKRLFSQGFLTALLNPKLAIFFAAFLPQFVEPAAGAVATQLTLLGLTFATLGIFSDGMYAMLAGTFGSWLKRQPLAARVLGQLSGITFIGLGARLATESQS